MDIGLAVISNIATHYSIREKTVELASIEYLQVFEVHCLLVSSSTVGIFEAHLRRC